MVGKQGPRGGRHIDVSWEEYKWMLKSKPRMQNTDVSEELDGFGQLHYFVYQLTLITDVH